MEAWLSYSPHEPLFTHFWCHSYLPSDNLLPNFYHGIGAVTGNVPLAAKGIRIATWFRSNRNKSQGMVEIFTMLTILYEINFILQSE